MKNKKVSVIAFLISFIFIITNKCYAITEKIDEDIGFQLEMWQVIVMAIVIIITALIEILY